MSGMKLLPCLSLNQIGHPPCGPERSAITQRLGALFQPLAQLVELLGSQTGFAAGSSSFLERLGSLFFPGLVPAIDRLLMHAQLPRNLSLSDALLKQFGRLKPPYFQLVEITFNAFGVSHTQNSSSNAKSCKLYYAKFSSCDDFQCYLLDFHRVSITRWFSPPRMSCEPFGALFTHIVCEHMGD